MLLKGKARQQLSGKSVASPNLFDDALQQIIKSVHQFPSPKSHGWSSHAHHHSKVEQQVVASSMAHDVAKGVRGPKRSTTNARASSSSAWYGPVIASSFCICKQKSGPPCCCSNGRYTSRVQWVHKKNAWSPYKSVRNAPLYGQARRRSTKFSSGYSFIPSYFSFSGVKPASWTPLTGNMKAVRSEAKKERAPWKTYQYAPISNSQGQPLGGPLVENLKPCGEEMMVHNSQVSNYTLVDKPYPQKDKEWQLQFLNSRFGMVFPSVWTASFGTTKTNVVTSMHFVSKQHSSAAALQKFVVFSLGVNSQDFVGWEWIDIRVCCQGDMSW